MVDIIDLYNKIEKYDVITFDVFDTLIIRDLPKPSELFKYEFGFLGKANRIFAEAYARRNSRYDEITLEDIYKFFPYNIDREIEFEKRICRANPKMLQFYNLIKDDKDIFFISDMYLSEKTIKEILEHSGYDNGKVYVSSSYGKTKVSGGLFKLFIKREKLEPSRICHIGDNEESDVVGARLAGIDSIKIDKHKIELAYRKITSKNYELNSFINHGICEIENAIERIGYEIVGPIILGFCQWIHEKYIHYGFDKMFFLARDMRFTYEMYKKIYAEDNVEYLYVSRKSLLAAEDNPKSFIEYLKEVGCYGNVTIVDTGWIGHAQVQIETYAKMIDPSTDIGGLYLGTQVPFRYIKRSERSEVCYYKTLFQQFKCELYPPFMETLIGTNEKQVISYSEGKAVFDRDCDIDQTNLIKNGAEIFVQEWIKLKGNKEIDKREAIKPFEKLFLSPRIEHINLLGDFEYENFKSTKLLTLSTDTVYCRNITKWLSDLCDSGWKGAFFKKSPWYFRILLKPYIFLNSIRIMIINK